MKTFVALVKREFLDGKNGYFRTPLILAGLTVAMVVLSVAGFGTVIHIEDIQLDDVHNLGDVLTRAVAQKPEHVPAGIALAYWGMSTMTWIAFPFVVFFSLLSSLYEERRDRSILFWKSMPVADWQEVLAKLVMPVFVAPFIFLGIVIAAQLAIALLLSLVVMFQGGPVLALWPLGFMFKGWFSMGFQYLIMALWALPLFAWVLLVSAYANRMPFLWAVLTPIVLIVGEDLVLGTHRLAGWIGEHMAGWQRDAYHDISVNGHIEGPRDLYQIAIGHLQWDAISYSFTSLHFWLGLVVAAGFIWGAIELRKRAV
ncbi:hypothetical protein [Kordiimonas marina]|uniref:hypothetical protein n=1 Tax=Kordiimonas marina TaxID=2872312 RepID=UPI001FF34A77|nr:hypothetical protein [Kordiimonas marina]MCJ9430803.1 hypothetical protein [Kordiimonas marina]